jgi:pimeloyl-ACP methyl ester carboxylesterase
MPSPTIVLVHGAFGDASSWRPVFDQLDGPGHQFPGGRAGDFGDKVAALLPATRAYSGCASLHRYVGARVMALILLPPLDPSVNAGR